MQNSAKNPPWARSNVSTNIPGMNPQIMDPNSIAMSQQGMMSFQQSFNNNMMQNQGGMSMPLAGQMQMNQGQLYPGNVVAYPTPRAMNPNLYQNTQSNQTQSNNHDQRVFTGTVTKCNNDFGFIDNDVFYQTSVCAKGIIPKVGDRVLVEATFNHNMPFKWNASRVQVLPKNNQTVNKPMPSKPSGYNAVPPPAMKKSVPPRRERSPPPQRREDRKRSRSRSRSRSRDRRESRQPIRRDSPPRKRPVVHQPSPPRYVVRVPRMPLDITLLDVPTVTQRYNNLYVPSDFFSAQVRWGETFPPNNPFSLSNPCNYHIMAKEADSPIPNDAVLEPPDADYRFYAKVMLISIPTLEHMYQKCGIVKSEDKEKEKDKRSSKSLHPTRLIKFLVGQKGKGGENFAIGGPWSPSLDGENPQTDPSVLVKTAIRTCKALTGVDLSSCTQWYRMVEFYYWRESSSGKSRLETVVLFLPDVWSTNALRDWPSTLDLYKGFCAKNIASLDAPDDSSQIEKADDSVVSIEDVEESEDKPEATHYSKLDLKTIKVEQLRNELKARGAITKGLRPQLLSRLSKLLKAEEAKSSTDDVVVLDEDTETKESEKEAESKEIESKEKEEEVKEKEKKPEKTEKEIEEEKKKIEKEKQLIKSRYELPSTPHIIVHPSATAKAGKFNCSVATLSLLLDYRTTDNKEHSFELFVFAELFNEMIMRDFGFYIYKTLHSLPEKLEDKEKDKSESKEKEKDKKEDRRDSKKKDTKEAQSDEERSSSPKQKSRGVDIPTDPHLLLSLVYFDTSRCYYITKKDLQSLFMSLGLKLSRSQVRSLLDKVCVKDNFSYKSLVQDMKESTPNSMDLTEEFITLDEDGKTSDDLVIEQETMLATGNRNLLPVFGKTTNDDATGAATKEVSEGAMILFKSRLIDVGATLEALNRCNQQKTKLETSLIEARALNRTLKANADKTQTQSRNSQKELESVTQQLTQAKNRIVSLMASSKIFHSALKSIQSKVDAVINIKYDDDDDVEIVNGSKFDRKDLRKEKDSKQSKEVKADSHKEKEIKSEKDTHTKKVDKELKNEKIKSEKDDKKEIKKEHSNIEINTKDTSKITENDSTDNTVNDTIDQTVNDKIDNGKTDKTVNDTTDKTANETDSQDKANDILTSLCELSDSIVGNKDNENDEKIANENVKQNSEQSEEENSTDNSKQDKMEVDN